MKKIYKESVKVRWSDLDPNMHLANQSYMSFTSFARMEALKKEGITLLNLQKWKRGPVIFEEKFNFFREILPHSTIYIHTTLSGISKDNILFKFKHNLYDSKGNHKAQSTIIGCWIDFNTRKMATHLPIEMIQSLDNLHNSNLDILTKEDLKNLGVKPINIDPKDI